MTEHFQKTASIKAVDEDERTATAAVLVPTELDHQADFLRPEAVERFFSDDVETGVMHAAFPNEAATLERSEVIDEPETIGDEEFPPGTWVARRRYEDDELWQLVKDGVLTGFSIGGDIADDEEHDTVPDDVRVPEAVPDDVADGPVTELIDGTVNEVSDVDLPAVPRATYKGRGLGKSVLDEVDGEEEFVELLVEQRGHSEEDARRLYAYLTDVKDGEKAAETEKPFTGPQGQQFDDFEDCVDTVEDWEDIDDPEAACGRWQNETKVDVNGTEVDLTPPVEVVNAVSEAVEAKQEFDDLSDCGTGRGEQRADQILNGDLGPEDFVSDENGQPIPAYHDSHEEDLPATDALPSEWDEETWTDGCGPVQAVLWGLIGDGTGKEWSMGVANEIHRARDEDIPYPEVTENMSQNDTDESPEKQLDKEDVGFLKRLRSALTPGSDDGTSPEALDTAKASDEDDDDEDKESAKELSTAVEDLVSEAAESDEFDDESDVIGELAQEAGIDESTVRQIMEGDIECPPIGRLEAFARVLDASVEDMIAAAEEGGCDYEEASKVHTLEKQLTPEQATIVGEAVEDFVDAHGDATVGEFHDWFWEMEWADELEPNQIVALSSAFEGWFDEMVADAQIVTEEFADWVSEQSDGEVELHKYATAGETAAGTMTDDTTKSEPPEWAQNLTEKVESIEKRVDEMEDDDAEKSLEDAPEWASDLAQKVDDLDERVETISKQSGHSQQLGKSADEEEAGKSNFTLDPRKGGR